MKNKKGFTLVELLAVIVVLVIITVIAINKISSVLRKNNENTVIANASVFTKAVEEKAGMSRITNTFNDGYYTVNVLFDMGITLSGTKPNDGSVILSNGKVVYACYIYDKYTYNYSNNKSSVGKNKSCDEIDMNKTFAYTGDVQEFDVILPGRYKLEVWGAQGGGKHQNTNCGIAGRGGYSSGTINLNIGDKLYVYVGGKGICTLLNGITDEGYNGGGYGWSNTGGASDVPCSGGGASDIRLVKASQGAWYDLNHSSWIEDQSLLSRIIVAGGGGGGGMDVETAGSGGGLSGVAANGAAGTQTTGHAFGKGADSTVENGSNASYGGPGAGGGWYGGQLSSWKGAGGGSGFIYTSSTTNLPVGYSVLPKYYLTNAQSIDGNNLMPTHDGSSTMTGNEGDGYVKITYLDDIESASQAALFSHYFPGYKKVDYIESTGTQYIDTEYIPKTNTKLVMELSFNGTFKNYNSNRNGTCDFIGSVESSGVGSFYINFGEDAYQGNQLYIWNNNDYGVNNQAIYDLSINDTLRTNRNTLTLDANKITYGSLERNLGGKLTNHTVSMYVFGAHVLNDPSYNGPFNSYNMRLYSMKIYEGDTLIRNLIPCYKGTDIGLCDDKTQKFYGNIGTGVFNKGIDL